MTLTHSNKYFDQDSLHGFYKLLYPQSSNTDADRAVNKYRKQLYMRYLNSNFIGCSIEELQKQAIIKSKMSSYELDIMIIHHMEIDFRDELAELYTQSIELINNTPISGIHLLIDEFKELEASFKKVKTTPDKLSSKSLYKNQLITNK